MSSRVERSKATSMRSRVPVTDSPISKFTRREFCPSWVTLDFTVFVAWMLSVGFIMSPLNAT